jgi:hypothetical protein
MPFDRSWSENVRYWYEQDRLIAYRWEWLTLQAVPYMVGSSHITGQNLRGGTDSPYGGTLHGWTEYTL